MRIWEMFGREGDPHATWVATVRPALAGGYEATLRATISLRHGPEERIATGSGPSEAMSAAARLVSPFTHRTWHPKEVA